MNSISNNQHPPAPFKNLLKHSGTEPLFTKAERARVVSIVEAEDALHARRSKLSPRALRDGIRKQAAAFATGNGEMPTQTLESTKSDRSHAVP